MKCSGDVEKVELSSRPVWFWQLAMFHERGEFRRIWRFVERARTKLNETKSTITTQEKKESIIDWKYIYLYLMTSVKKNYWDFFLKFLLNVISFIISVHAACVVFIKSRKIKIHVNVQCEHSVFLKSVEVLRDKSSSIFGGIPSIAINWLRKLCYHFSYFFVVVAEVHFCVTLNRMI